jgi:RNase P protein component
MTPGRDVVVVARRGAAELDLERTAEELLACLRDPGA